MNPLVEGVLEPSTLSKAFEAQNPVVLLANWVLADFVPRISTPCVAVCAVIRRGYQIFRLLCHL